MSKKETVVEILKLMKGEVDKRNMIYEHGVDLINYENNFLKALFVAIHEIMGKDVKNDIEWWLWEDVEKIYYYANPTREVNVESAEDFYDIGLDEKEV